MMSVTSNLVTNDSWTRASVLKPAAPAVRPPSSRSSHRGRRSFQSRSRRWSSWQSRFQHYIIPVLFSRCEEASPEEARLVSAAAACAPASAPALAPVPCAPCPVPAPALASGSKVPAPAAAPCVPAPAVAAPAVAAPAIAFAAAAAAAAATAAAAAAAAAASLVTALAGVGNVNAMRC